MSGPQVLLPLRIPELGPYLGKVVAGTGRTPGGLRLGAVRLRLATRLFERAGEARRLAARDQREAAASALGRQVWLEAWEEAVGSVATLFMNRWQAQLDAEARAVRLPKRARRRALPQASDRAATAARFGAAGAALVTSLDEIDRRAVHALAATGLEREAVAAWQHALCVAARRMEAAWLALEESVDREAERWRGLADDIARWRPSLWPMLGVSAAAVGCAVWLGLVVGGYLAPPAWLSFLWQEVMRW